MAKKIMQVGYVAAGVLAFISIFLFKDFRAALVVMGAATVILCLLVLPPWPMYRRNPVTFAEPLPPKEKKKKEKKDKKKKKESESEEEQEEEVPVEKPKKKSDKKLKTK